MSRFFERNKRKSALALLLLLFGRRRDLGLLLLMVLVLLYVFVLPPDSARVFGGWIARVPGGAFLVPGGRRPDFSDLIAGFRAAKKDRRPLWGFFLRSGTAAGSAGGSSLDMVQGRPSDFSLPSHGVNVGGAGTTIGGIMTPEEAQRRADAVSVGGDEAGQRERVIRAGFGLDALSGVGAFASRAFFKAGRSAASTPDAASAALSATQIPQAGHSTAGAGRLTRQAAAQGSLVWSLLNRVLGRGNSSSTLGGDGAKAAFHQLAEGRSQAMISRDPVCTAGDGCAPEFASTHVGAVYDGNHAGSGVTQLVTTTPQIDGVSVVNPPSGGEIGAYNDEAAKLEEEMKECQAADAKYNPQEQAIQDDIQNLSNQMNASNCGGGGCSVPSVCTTDGDKMKADCNQLNSVMTAHWAACPLRQKSGPAPQHDCH